MDESLATILAFVAGELTPSAFRDRLYADGQFEPLLSNDPRLKPGTFVGHSVYLYLFGLDYNDPGDVLNAQGALVDFLTRNGIGHHPTSGYEDSYDLVLRAQPRWIAVEPGYVQDRMLPAAGLRSGIELEKWLRGEFLRLFRYVDAPPEWIQCPAWPISENGPLVFLGQVEVLDYFHDRAVVYVFHDPATGSCESIIQVA